MEPQSDAPEQSNPRRPYKPASVTLIILKSIVIAMSVVIAVSFASRGAMALVGLDL